MPRLSDLTTDPNDIEVISTPRRGMRLSEIAGGNEAQITFVDDKGISVEHSALDSDRYIKESVRNSIYSKDKYPAVSERDRPGFIKSMGMNLYAGALEAANGINKLLGLGVFKATRDLFILGGEAEAKKLREDSRVDGIGQFANDFSYGLGNMGATLPLDIMTGGATKVSLAGKITPKVEALMAKIPSFALGMGERAFAEKAEEGKPLEAPIAGAEATSLGILYGVMGTGWQMFPKMGAMGLSESHYEALKEGRLATSEEMITGTANGLAFASVFHTIGVIEKHITNIQEKSILADANKNVGKAVEAGDIDAVKGEYEKILTNEGVSKETKQAIQTAFEEMKAEHIKNETETPKVFLTKSEMELLDIAMAKKASNIEMTKEERGVIDKVGILKAQEETPPEVRGGLVPPEMNFGNWKDKNAFLLSRETLERNIEDLAGKEAQKVKEYITEPIKINETKRAEFLNEMRSYISEKMKSLDIKYGSLADKYVQRYGEKKATLDEIKNKFPKNWENIVKASEFFRGLYDDMLNTVNATRSKFGYGPIPKRADYFRHYQELGSVIKSFGVLLREEDLPTNIAGITGIFKPGKPFSTAELQRLGEKTTESAIGGVDNYLDSISKQMFHIDSVQRVRSLEKYIRKMAEVDPEIKLQNLVSNITEYGNLLAGKKAQFDRAFESVFGRPFYGVIRFIQSRTSANMIAGNVSSALTNFIPFTQSFATTEKLSATKGIFEGLISPFVKDFNKIDGVKSELLTRRYPADKIALSFLGKSEKFAGTLFKSIDQFTAKSILAGKYYEGIKKGLGKEKAMKEADNYTSRILADRSWGQLPNLMSTKTLGPITQFQTEINNMMSFIEKDIPRQYKGDFKKVANATIQFAIYSYLFNELFEKITGRRPTIDPIYAFATLTGMSPAGKDKNIGERSYTAIKDFTGNVPFGNIFMQGGRIPISAGIPDFSKIIKDGKVGELKKLAFYVAFPFAGGQVKKTIEGLYDYAKGGSETPKGRTRYAIEQDFANFMKGFLFGKGAFSESVDYYNEPKGSRGSDELR